MNNDSTPTFSLKGTEKEATFSNVSDIQEHNKEYRPGNSVILETEVEEPYNVMKKPDPEIVNKYLNKRKSPNEQLHFYGHGDEKAFSFQDISMLSLSGNKFGGNENEDETNLNFFFGRNRTLKIDGEEAQETVQIDPIVKEKRKSEADVWLSRILAASDEEELYKKAASYFKDAIFGRNVRLSFRSKIGERCYNFQTHPLWGSLITFFVWIYLLLTFFEPSCSVDTSMKLYSTTYWALFSIETTFIIFFLIDDILDILHRSSDQEKSKIKHFLKNKKALLKNIIDVNLFIDFILFWILYNLGIPYFRYGRLFRPFKLILHVRELRRFFKSVIITLPYIIDMIIIFILFSLIFAILGVKVFEDIKDDLDQDQIREDNNFNDIGHALWTLYILITFSNYPAVMNPYYNSSKYYFFYFFPFICFALIFLVPIPVAVVFDAFRKYRMKTILKDRLRGKHAIFAVYSCLDKEKKGYITLAQWNKLMSVMHNEKEDKEKVVSVFKHFDAENIDKLNMFEFFEACDLVLCLRDLGLPYLCDPVWWNKFRTFCNDKLKIRTIVTSTIFEMCILILVILNLVILILTATTSDEEKLEIYDLIDRILLYIFVLEVILKVIGLGVTKYWDDNWNKFDFTLVVMSLFLDLSINFMQFARSARTAKAAKASKVAKGQRSLKILKGLKSFRAGRILSAGAGPFIRIKDMIRKIILCFPSVKKLFHLLMLILYTYAILGMEVFREYGETTVYSSSFFGNFETFGESVVLLFQITTQASWHCPMFHYGLNINYTGSMFYFISFHLITVFILFSIITGLVWELFTILDEKSKKIQTQYEEQADKIQEKQELDDQRSQEDIIRNHSVNAYKNAVRESSVIVSSGMVSQDESSLQNTLKNQSASISMQSPGRKTQNSNELQLPENKMVGQKNIFFRGGTSAPCSSGVINVDSSSVINAGSLGVVSEVDSDEKKNTKAGFMKTLQNMKSEYLLRKALLKDTSKTSIQSKENEYLKKKFSCYQSYVDKVCQEFEDPDKQAEKKEKSGSLILNSLRIINNSANEQSLIESFHDIFFTFRKLAPLGTFIHIVFESEENVGFLFIDHEFAHPMNLNYLKEQLHLNVDSCKGKAKTIPIKKFFSQKDIKISEKRGLRFISAESQKDPYEELFESLTKYAEIRGYFANQLDSYTAFDWNLICTCISLTGDEKQYINILNRTNELASPTIPEYLQGQLIEDSDRVTKAYVIALVPKQIKNQIEERKHERIKRKVSKIFKITGKQEIEAMNPFNFTELNAAMNDFGIILQNNKFKIFEIMNRFSHNSTFLNKALIGSIFTEWTEKDDLPSPSNNSNDIEVSSPREVT